MQVRHCPVDIAGEWLVQMISLAKRTDEKLLKCYFVTSRGDDVTLKTETSVFSLPSSIEWL